MSDFKYLRQQFSKTGCHFVCDRTFLFRYVGPEKQDYEIVKELKESFSRQHFGSLSVVNRDGMISLHLLAGRKNINIPLQFSKYDSVHPDLFFIHTNYNFFSSKKFVKERASLEEALEAACKELCKQSGGSDVTVRIDNNC